MSTPPAGTGRRLGSPVAVAWFIVLAMMLIAAAWSISSKLMGWGMDEKPAYALSLMFDLAGLLCAQYAKRAIERNTPAGLPRTAVLAFVTVSGILNWSHGLEVGGTVGGIGLASISLAVELLFELHRRDVRDEQRSARGLVAERMPYIPALAWVMFPGDSWKALRTAVRTRLDTLDTVTRPATAVTSVDRVSDGLLTPPVTAPVTAPPAPPALPSSPTPPPPPPPARKPAPRPPVVPVGARFLPVICRQALPPAPAPAPARGQAVIEYSDPRCKVIRALYNTQPPTRPGTKAMRDAIEKAGLEFASDGWIRGTLRTEVERHEPHLALLPRAPFAMGA